MTIFASRVELGKKVNYSDLEKALLNAALDLGWKAEIKQEFDRKFVLGSVKEVDEYSRTLVRVRSRLLPQLRISLYDRDTPSSFSLYNGFPYGFASDKKAKEYLEAVSMHL